VDIQGYACYQDECMKVAFRVDASFEIGTGHIMRCLTLAHALRQQGYESLFICREHLGNLITFVQNQGFSVYTLPLVGRLDNHLTHAAWLGASQAYDAEVCKELLASYSPDWLVVDHYALDYRWEVAVTHARSRILVIDDLADRKHVCDILIDQNLGRFHSDYKDLLPHCCRVLTGPHYALLRPEFARMRNTSLARRASFVLSEVLIALGGVDQHNYTGKILEHLQNCGLPQNIRFTVVLGTTAPHIEKVKSIASVSPWPVEVLSGINDMADRMSNADLAIGAGGITSWERCCLGLPTLLLVLAENQVPASKHLVRNKAAIIIDPQLCLVDQLQQAFNSLSAPLVLQSYSIASQKVTDGLGIERVLKEMRLVKPLI